jgi:hypothetical protein
MINVDAAIFSQSKLMGSGVLIRDHSGVCLAATHAFFERVSSSELAEAKAVKTCYFLCAGTGGWHCFPFVRLPVTHFKTE